MEMKKIIIIISILLALPFIQSSTTFFDCQNDFFIMVNHSFLQEGLSGAFPISLISPPINITEEPEIIIKEREIVKEVIKIVKIVPWYMWFIVVFLFLLGWRRKGKIRILKKKNKEKQKGKKIKTNDKFINLG